MEQRKQIKAGNKSPLVGSSKVKHKVDSFDGRLVGATTLLCFSWGEIRQGQVYSPP
jgi:hypothetical protein